MLTNARYIETGRLVDTKFEPGTYGFLMADMLMEIGNGSFKDVKTTSPKKHHLRAYQVLKSLY